MHRYAVRYLTNLVPVTLFMERKRGDGDFIVLLASITVNKLILAVKSNIVTASARQEFPIACMRKI